MFLRSVEMPSGVMIDTSSFRTARVMRSWADEDENVAPMIDRLRRRQEWQFFRALRRAAPA
ncbi:MAG: hypothetical protein ACXVJ3_17625, partial [Ilumatobacteraceae bacterium]